jgi:hypothetical protein
MLYRAETKGIGHTPMVIWRAYQRWELAQSLPLHEEANPSPKGWLDSDPGLVERRGFAPATANALRERPRPTAGLPARGFHALTRTVPLAAARLGRGWYRDCARWTHHDHDVYWNSVEACEIVELILDGEDLIPAAAACHQPIDNSQDLASVAPGHDCGSALRGALLIASRCESRDGIRDALESTRKAPVPTTVGPVTGALLGAAYGVEALLVDLLARMELTWVVDTLARDLHAQITEHPGGHGYEAPDPMWHRRYPPG